MNLPSLSVVVPNYNHAQHLPRCLQALLSQSLPPQEVVVVNDGSTDDSVTVIRRLMRDYPSLRLLQNDQNRGVTQSVNRGIDAATGDYVFLQAADDEILPGFFAKTVGLLAKHPEAGLACTVGHWRELHTGIHWHMGLGMTDQPAYLAPAQVVRLQMQGRLFIPGHTAVYRRDAFIEAGKLIPSLRHYSDWFAVTVVAFRRGLCVVPEPLAIFNIEPNNYYQRNRRDRTSTDAAIAHTLKLLHEPRYADVTEAFRRSGALYICGLQVLPLLLRNPQYRCFITARLLRRVLWHSTRVTLKRYSPPFLVNWYAGIAGYRQRPGRVKTQV